MGRIAIDRCCTRLVGNFPSMIFTNVGNFPQLLPQQCVDFVVLVRASAQRTSTESSQDDAVCVGHVLSSGAWLAAAALKVQLGNPWRTWPPNPWLILVFQGLVLFRPSATVATCGACGVPSDTKHVAGHLGGWQLPDSCSSRRV